MVPRVDGDYLEEHPGLVMRKGLSRPNYNNPDIIIGVTRDVAATIVKCKKKNMILSNLYHHPHQEYVLCVPLLSCLLLLIFF